MMAKVLLSFLAGALLSCLAQASVQQLGIKGRLICPMEPHKAKDVKILLVDKDTGWDDSLSKGKSNATGHFALNGTAFDVAGDVDVQLKIYHSCLVGFFKSKLCDRRLAYKIPNSYLTSALDGKDKMKIVDIGVINLELEPRKEDSCNLSG